MTHLRFLLRATLLLAACLAMWWFVLRLPLLGWVQFSADLLVRSLPVRAPTGVEIEAGRVWNLQVPIPGGHSVHIRAQETVPTLFIAALPLYWAVLLAAPWTRRMWLALAIGTAVFLVLPAFSLMVYAAHVVKLTIFPTAYPFAGYLLNVADYLTATVIPFVLPPILAVALHPDLRALVLAGQAVSAKPAAARPAAARRS